MLTTEASSQEDIYDAVVIGTGFAGAVTVCRLVEAGFRVCVLERGRRYGKDDFPRVPADPLFKAIEGEGQFRPLPDYSRFSWRADHGLYDVQDLGDALSVQAAGYGGGSLVYANVHLRPPMALFDERWPKEYRNGALNRYFDLAAYMLRVAAIPKRLAKTLQHKRVADKANLGAWFRTPLAVNFEEKEGVNAFGREQHACDMRGLCDLGCNNQSKNSLDLNYLARAEDDEKNPPYIRTLAEVVEIHRKESVFTVRYIDHLVRRTMEEIELEEEPQNPTADECDFGPPKLSVNARSVFLCAGAVHTTKLLLKSADGLWHTKPKPPALGSHYFTNASSLSVVFNCDEPHEADYGPTITSALLYDSPDKSEFRYSLDFVQSQDDAGEFSDLLDFARAQGGANQSQEVAPSAGATVSCGGFKTTLAADPILDWGNWKDGTAVGTLLLTAAPSCFKLTRDMRIKVGKAKVTARFPLREHNHWFLVEDGGFPSNLEPLLNVFRSPVWLRRNRFRETPPKFDRLGIGNHRLSQPSDAPQRAARQSGFFRGFNLGRARRSEVPRSGGGSRSQSEVLGIDFRKAVPKWLLDVLHADRMELFQRGGQAALPLLGELLSTLSASFAQQIDEEALAKQLSGAAGSFQNQVGRTQLEILIRGLLRQVLQILAGSEVRIAQEAFGVLGVPKSIEELWTRLLSVLPWLLAYERNDGHTAVLLTIGRDVYRGRLRLCPDANGEGELRAQIPGGVLDAMSVTEERVARAFALQWGGELRSNPAWQTLRQHLTVHSQGGCPMGDSQFGVTGAGGEVHGCSGLYVMDAAAFPVSVGVNPSATILAIAEYKVRQFIRQQGPGMIKNEDEALKEALANWETCDRKNAEKWFKEPGRRKELDPLNAGEASRPASRAEPARLNVLGLTFQEQFDGNFVDVKKGSRRIPENSDLDRFRLSKRFAEGESKGVKAGKRIELHLKAEAADLARVIADPAISRVKIPLSGTIKVDGEKGKVENEVSFLQLFLTDPDPKRPIRYFRYELVYTLDDQNFLSRETIVRKRLRGLKILKDQPGLDVWHDTATLYFEIGPVGRDEVERRGILRVGVDAFLKKQLPSFDITGTCDPARKTWALAAFAKYFASELSVVYSRRQRAAIESFVNILMSVPV